MVMRKAAAIALVALAVCWIGSAEAYEFKLLNGMKIKGALRSFKDGWFVVDTDMGSVSIGANKLDYIVVEESDPGPCDEAADAGEPGIGICHRPPPSVKGIGMVEGPGGAAAAPMPLSARSVMPSPMAPHSIPATPDTGRPAPLGTFSVDAARAFPGVFRGNPE